MDGTMMWHPNLTGPWDEWFPPEPERGYLYVMAFDSGWTKVGLTTDWEQRRSALKTAYRRLGWSVSRTPWKSCVVPREDLDMIEKRLIIEARRTSDSTEFNPRIRGVGRDRTRLAGTELFHGCTFDYLVAYADVLAQTDALI
jgi:hypothetical protein